MASGIEFKHAYYPESDGKPMGETDEHRQEMVRHIELLEYFFRGQQVYVSGNLLLYYEQGNPRKFVVPDAFIAKGLSHRPRRIYKVWVEGKAPDLVIETTSRKTRRKDMTEKPAIYARLGVKELFLFDPDEEYLEPPLQGHRLAGTGFVAIVPESDGSLMSQELGLRLGVGEGHLQFVHPETGERLLTGAERAEREAEARRALEVEVARLRDALARQTPL